MKKATIFSALFFIVLISSCSRVPITKRKQLKLLSTSEMQAMSYEQYKLFMDSAKISTNRQQVAMIKRVGNKIKNAVEEYMNKHGHSKWLKGYEWEFNLIDDPTQNAWCMPGGKVCFYTGIMDICQDEKGVAVVMGHEIAHAIARHGNERMSQALVQQLGFSVLSEALKNKPGKTKNIFYQAVGIGSAVGVMLPFSRKHESEADHMGLIFMAMADYDPQEAPKFWERMKAMTGDGGPEFMSTHPSNDRRIADLKSHMPEALEYYKK